MEELPQVYKGIEVGDDALGDKEGPEIVEVGVELSENVKALGQLAPGFRTFPEFNIEDIQTELGVWATKKRWDEKRSRQLEEEKERDKLTAHSLRVA